MRIVVEETKVYVFDELSSEAKQDALCDFINSMVETGGLGYEEDSEFLACVAEAERCQTPWFLGEIILENMKDRIVEDIKLNEYEYTEDGNMYVPRKVKK